MSNKTLAMKLIAVLGIASLMFLVGCGGTTGQSINQPPAGVTVSPASVTVQAGGVQQFTATVSPSGTNQAVTWSLSGTGCGSKLRNDRRNRKIHCACERSQSADCDG